VSVRKAATLKDVARLSGVTPGTASVILNGAKAGTRVSEATRQRVARAARELEYRPNASARRLKRQRADTVAALFCHTGAWEMPLRSPYTFALLEGFLLEGRETGYSPLVWAREWTDAATSAPEFRTHAVDGVLTVLPARGSDYVTGLAGAGVLQVVVGAESGVHGVPWIDVDNVHGGRLAARHLLALGHRRIAFLGGAPEYDFNPVRERGFRDALAEGGVPLDPAYRMEPTYNLYVNHKEIGRLLDGPNPPTAVFAWTDAAALEAINAARQRGLSVPRDLSVIGFDDQTGADRADPPLTTVRQPVAEIGRRSLRTLIALIEGEPLEAEGVRVAPELIVRESTAPPPPRR
jgi:LacI family transcriptional regulator